MANPSVARPPRQSRFSGLGWRRARWGYVFIAPWLIGFLAFTAIPMIATLGFSFTNINLAQAEPLTFVGLKNYEKLLKDQQVWDSLAITLKFAAIALPVAVILPLLVALMLHTRHLYGAGAFRVLFFLPYVVPFVAGVFIWGGMLNPSTGWINLALQAVGVENPPAWLEDPTWVYPGLALIGVWGIGAGMIVYLAGLKGIPTDLYEAARIDGAGAFASLRHITIPMLTPVIFFTIVLVGRRGHAVFPRPAGAPERHGRARRLDDVLQPVPVQELLHVPEHVVRGDARVAPVRDHAGHHAHPVRDGPALGLLRG